MPAVKVFMSYRRADNPFLAGRLKDELGRVFGDDNVFYDVDSIRAGSDFRAVIRETLGSVDAVIALVGSDWDAARLAASNDPVRTELREALGEQKLLIPVLVGDTVMPTPEQLPAELETFAFLNAVRVRPDPDFENDANNLIQEIVQGVGGTATIPAAGAAAGAGASDRPPRRGVLAWFTGKRIALVGAGLVAAIALAFVLGRLDDDNNAGNGDGAAATTPSTETPTAAAQREAEVIVDGATARTDTGFDVTAGDRVIVAATGMVFHNPEASIGPDGVRNVAQLQGPLGSDHHAGLIGQIGDTGAPFLVGAAVDYTAPVGGRLFLGINDIDLSTNSGAFDATVTIIDG